MAHETGMGSVHKSEVGGLAIEFSHVSHSFVQGNVVVDAIGDVSLELAPGEFVSVIGPSGCGKTTLLNMVAGVVRPTAGRVSLGGAIVGGPSRSIGYMLARDALLPWRSVIGNVLLGLETRGVSRVEAKRAAAEWLDRVGLGSFANARIWELSQGMRQRVALARTLVLHPQCILMDEPFAAVDAQTRASLQQEFVGLWERYGSTVMFVTHDITEAVLLSDRVVLMSARPGNVVLDVPIDLPRPRTLDLLRGHPKLVDYVNLISDSLKRVSGSDRDCAPSAASTNGGEHGVQF